MFMRWRVGRDVVDGSTFRPPKDLILEAVNAYPTPKQFDVYQVYGPADKQLRDKFGIPRLKSRQTAFMAKPARKPLEFVGDRPWQLPTAKGFHICNSFAFMADNSSALSGVIRSHRFLTTRIRADSGVNLSLPVPGIDAVPIGAGGTAGMITDVQSAVDPVLQVDVLTGEALLDLMLRNLLIDVEDADPDVRARVETGMERVREELMSEYTPPPGWNFTTSQRQLEVAENHPVEVGLDLRLPTPGSGYIAVSFADVKRLDDPEGGILTEVLGIRVLADGTVLAIPDVAQEPSAGFSTSNVSVPPSAPSAAYGEPSDPVRVGAPSRQPTVEVEAEMGVW